MSVPTNRPFSPVVKVAKGRLIVQRGDQPRYALPFQYNPEHVSRSLSVQASGSGGAGRAEAPAFSGAAKETISLEARLEAVPGVAGSDGVLPLMAAIELLLYPTTDDVRRANATLDAGKRSVVGWPMPRITLEWGQRAVPVSLKSVKVDEQDFDATLTPVRAVLSLSFDVVSYSSVSEQDTRSQLFIEHQKYLESLAAGARASAEG